MQHSKSNIHTFNIASHTHSLQHSKRYTHSMQHSKIYTHSMQHTKVIHTFNATKQLIHIICIASHRYTYSAQKIIHIQHGKSYTHSTLSQQVIHTFNMASHTNTQHLTTTEIHIKKTRRIIIITTTALNYRPGWPLISTHNRFIKLTNKQFCVLYL